MLRIAGVLNILAIVVLSLVDVAGPVLWAAFLAERVLQILLYTTLLTYTADCVPTDIPTLGIAVYGLSGLIPIAVANLVGDPLLANVGHQGLLASSAAVAVVSWALVWRLPLLPVLGHHPNECAGSCAQRGWLHTRFPTSGPWFDRCSGCVILHMHMNRSFVLLID